VTARRLAPAHAATLVSVRAFLRWSDRIFLGIAGLLSAGFLVSISLQVLFRYVLELPLPWTEELSRYMFVWAALIAAAVSVGRNDQFVIPILYDHLPAAVQRALDILIQLLAFAFAAIMVWYGFQMADRLMMAGSPVLPIPQGTVYLVIPIAGLYMAVHILGRLAARIVGGDPAW
jgi:TRAP-type C4-dicarboxylate transport system permease small subunit